MQYRTKDGDVLDQICTHHYGAGNFDLQDVLEANRELATFGPVLPSGVVLELPAVIQTPDRSDATIRLWS